VAAQFGDVLLTAQSFEHDPDVLFRKILLTCQALNVLDLFCRRPVWPAA
jgi:hypothetical protein